MDLQNVSNDDGRACARLLILMNSGTWTMTGAESNDFQQAKRWLHDLSLKMAKALSPPKPDAPAPATTDAGFRVIGAGPLPRKGRRR